MTLLRVSTLVIALLLALSEIGRWWGKPRMLPLVLDELVVALALLIALRLAPRQGTAPLAAAWALFSGLMLSLLVPTLDHMLFGPPKESAGFYAGALGALLAVGVWATLRALRLARPA